MEGKELAIIGEEQEETSITLYTEELSGRPKQVLMAAKEAAVALREVIQSKPDKDKAIFNGKQYLDNGDWQLLGKFNGITAKVTSTKYVEFGSVKGFEAEAVALNAGEIISSAKSLCLNDEPKWNTEDEERTYHKKDGSSYKKKIKGKPLFQLMSMAETRACSKVLRTVLGWIPVLAGYSSTPAEEMDGVIEQKPSTPPSQPRTQNNDTLPEIKTLQTKIRNAIWKMVSGDKKKYAQMLESCSSYEKDGKFYKGVDTLGKITNIDYARHTWRKTEKAYKNLQVQQKDEGRDDEGFKKHREKQAGTETHEETQKDSPQNKLKEIHSKIRTAIYKLVAEKNMTEDALKEAGRQKIFELSCWTDKNNIVHQGVYKIEALDTVKRAGVVLGKARRAQEEKGQNAAPTSQAVGG